MAAYDVNLFIYKWWDHYMSLSGVCLSVYVVLWILCECYYNNNNITATYLACLPWLKNFLMSIDKIVALMLYIDDNLFVICRVSFHCFLLNKQHYIIIKKWFRHFTIILYITLLVIKCVVVFTLNFKFVHKWKPQFPASTIHTLSAYLFKLLSLRNSILT